MSIGINWAEIWADDVWGPVWLQEAVVPPVTTDTTDGFGGAKSEELVHEVGAKPKHKAKPLVRPPSIITPKVRPPKPSKPEKKERPRKKKLEPSIEVAELQIAPQFTADPQLSVAPVLELFVSMSFCADPQLLVAPALEFLDDAVAIAIGHPELAQLIGDFLPVPQFDKPPFMGYDLV